MTFDPLNLLNRPSLQPAGCAPVVSSDNNVRLAMMAYICIPICVHPAHTQRFWCSCSIDKFMLCKLHPQHKPAQNFDPPSLLSTFKSETCWQCETIRLAHIATPQPPEPILRRTCVRLLRSEVRSTYRNVWVCMWTAEHVIYACIVYHKYIA